MSIVPQLPAPCLQKVRVAVTLADDSGQSAMLNRNVADGEPSSDGEGYKVVSERLQRLMVEASSYARNRRHQVIRQHRKTGENQS